jgi:glycerol-3-phosphate O-acyltransferase / dihydroxyacetone phosphate acyltransferase
MLYRLLKWLVRLTLQSYFRRIAITGSAHIPTHDPAIFVANHPSAFMDPMVVATVVGRPVHFLAAAEFFGKGFKSWFYQRSLNMIPVYRPTTMPGETHKNEDIFEKCIDLLKRGGAILVFPEGNSITETRIRKLKTGAARMALGTKDATHGKVDVKIVPVGLNYANPHRFQSDLFINIGGPLSTSPYANDKEGVVLFTAEIEKSLKETVLHVDKQEYDSVAKKAALILKVRGPSKGYASKATLSKQQKVMEAIHQLSDTQPKTIADLETKLDRYLGKIKDLGLADSSIANLSVLVSIGASLRLVITLPLFSFGYLVNCLPYYATVFYFRRLKLFEVEGRGPEKEGANPAFKGSVAMAIGMVMFLLFYLVLIAIFVWFFGNFWITFALVVLFYLSGLFVMEYLRWYYAFEQQLKLRKLITDNREVFASLVLERQAIVNELSALGEKSGSR